MQQGIVDDYLYTSGRRYDLMWPLTGDLPFWLGQARRYGGPVLELACGTGRVAIPLSQAGYSVTGIDLAEGMLAAAREKSARLGVDSTWMLGDVRDCDLSRRFALIILAANGLCHLLTVSDFERTMACVTRHLLPDGRFILSVFVPDFQTLTGDPGGRHPFAEYTDPWLGEAVTVWERNLYHPDTQINHITLFRLGPDGAEVGAGGVDMRMYFPQELDALLKYNGLPVEHKYGSHDGRHFGPGSTQQIPVCAPKAVGTFGG
jgi:SAM-dependent methyltransferase